ncbi:MAG: hypothetical protein ABIE22_00755 [archaeon]
MVENGLVQKIRAEQGEPLIGVIGATRPSPEYRKATGMLVGSSLRKYLRWNPGVIFTGGVEGVGVDVYDGVAAFLEKRFLKSFNADKFFVLVPELVAQKASVSDFLTGPVLTEYQPPKEYFDIAKKCGNELEVVRAGKDMTERREYVGRVADVLVAVNGGFGTLDESYQAMKQGTPVISLWYSGGGARDLTLIKQGKLPEKEKAKLAKFGINFEEVDRELIKAVDGHTDMIIALKAVLKNRKV